MNPVKKLQGHTLASALVIVLLLLLAYHIWRKK